MPSYTVKVSRKNQLTLPEAMLRALGYPTHFKAYLLDGNAVLFPATLTTHDEQADHAGIPRPVLREAHRLVAERRAKKPDPIP